MTIDIDVDIDIDEWSIPGIEVGIDIDIEGETDCMKRYFSERLKLIV